MLKYQYLPKLQKLMDDNNHSTFTNKLIKIIPTFSVFDVSRMQRQIPHPKVIFEGFLVLFFSVYFFVS